MDSHDKVLMEVSNLAAHIYLKLCELNLLTTDIDELCESVRAKIESDIDYYDTVSCDIDNLARGACSTVHIRE